MSSRAGSRGKRVWAAREAGTTPKSRDRLPVVQYGPGPFGRKARRVDQHGMSKPAGRWG